MPRDVSYYNPVIERMSRSELLDLQWKRLKHFLEHLYRANPYFRKRLQEARVTPDEIKNREDFAAKIPLTTKTDLLKDQEEKPLYGLRLGVPEDKLVHTLNTSGTSGMGQELYGLTRADLEVNTWPQCFYWLGIRPGDVCVSTSPMSVGLLAAPTASTYGLMKLGANFIHLGLNYRTEEKVALMKRFSPHSIYALSGHYLRRLATACQEQGIEPRRDYPRLKSIMCPCGGFPTEWLRHMEDFWGAKIYEAYGLTPTRAPLGCTCERGAVANDQRGMLHLLEHMVFVEILDRETRQPVAPGEEGEVVLTPLCFQASPVLRFASNDKVKYLPHNYCSCGRPFDSIESGSIARFDDMMKIRGMNVWPEAVQRVMVAHEEVEEYQGKVWAELDGREEVSIAVEFKRGVSEERKGTLLALVEGELKRAVGVDMSVKESGKPLPRFDFKAVRWSDERKKGLKRVVF